MSRSESKQRLHVLSEDGVQITILDQTLTPIKSGVKSLEADLPPGLYEARFEAGSSVREHIIALEPGSGPVTVRQEPMAFASAAPLADTRGTIAQQSKAAARISRKTHRHLGRGGQLLIFVRDEDLLARSNSARSLTIHSLDGEQVGEVETDGESGGGSRRQPRWAGCNYQLRAGSWRLRCRVRGFGLVEQSVVVSPKWQTQVFLQRRHLLPGGKRWPDLADASVLMAETRQKFQPQLGELRATELARQALRDRRIAVPRTQIQAMLYNKRKNPMLAIYGAHLMIQEADLDRDFLKSVIAKLLKLVGNHPDVMALQLLLDPRAEVGVFSEPPMLYSSWQIVVAATAKRPELVPRGSLSALISESVLAGGPWLRWRVPPNMPKPEVRPTQRMGQPLGEAIAGVVDALPQDPATLWEDGEQVPVAESEILTLATTRPDVALDASDSDLVEQLGLPRTVAEDAISSVMERLDE